MKIQHKLFLIEAFLMLTISVVGAADAHGDGYLRTEEISSEKGREKVPLREKLKETGLFPDDCVQDIWIPISINGSDELFGWITENTNLKAKMYNDLIIISPCLTSDQQRNSQQEPSNRWKGSGNEEPSNTMKPLPPKLPLIKNKTLEVSPELEPMELPRDFLESINLLARIENLSTGDGVRIKVSESVSSRNAGRWYLGRIASLDETSLVLVTARRKILISYSIIENLTLSSNTVQREASTSSLSGWFSFGVGGSSLGSEGLAAHASLSFQRGHFLVTMRTTGVSEYFLNFFETGDEFTDYGLLFGIAVKGRGAHASIATGLALLKGNKKRLGEIQPKVGLPIDIQLFPKLFSAIGLGLNVFMNINSVRSYVGATVGMQIGKLR